MLGRGESEQEQLIREQRETQDRRDRQQHERSMASGAAQQAIAEGVYAQPGYWSTVLDLDIGFDEIEDDYIEDFISVEGSKHLALGNYSYSDWKSLCWRIENMLWTRRNELQKNAKLDDIDMATMGYDTGKPHTDEREARLKAAELPLKNMASLGINGEALRRGTEMHVATRSESGPDEDEDGGWGSRLKSWLGT